MARKEKGKKSKQSKGIQNITPNTGKQCFDQTDITDIHRVMTILRNTIQVIKLHIIIPFNQLLYVVLIQLITKKSTFENLFIWKFKSTCLQISDVAQCGGVSLQSVHVGNHSGWGRVPAVRARGRSRQEACRLQPASWHSEFQTSLGYRSLSQNKTQ